MNSFLTILSTLLQADETRWLFKSEKVNTILVVMLVIWVGIVVYLLWTGQKISKLEARMEELKQQRGDQS